MFESSLWYRCLSVALTWSNDGANYHYSFEYRLRGFLQCNIPDNLATAIHLSIEDSRLRGLPLIVGYPLNRNKAISGSRFLAAIIIEEVVSCGAESGSSILMF